VTETVGARIRALRKKKNLTLEQLADQAGLSKSYLWELENKDPPRPSGEKLAGIAKTLEVTVDYLLGGDAVEKLETAEDKAFFRDYHGKTAKERAAIRRMAKALDQS
jgi:transcriptional regulator with XRE-family HTH domain